MALEVDLSPSGNLQLRLTTGRTLEVPPTIDGVKYLIRMIRESRPSRPPNEQRKGYLRDFPTQHVIEQWKKKDAARRQEQEAVSTAERKQAAEVKAQSLGLDLSKIGLKL